MVSQIVLKTTANSCKRRRIDEPGGAEAAAETESAGPTLEEIQAKADENWDRYLRAAAETENVRKRAARDVEHARKYALEAFRQGNAGRA